MASRLILRERSEQADGSFYEIVIWRVAAPISPCKHHFKYRLVWIKDGKRWIGFDNERGKGDHFHHRNTESRYQFESIEKLLEDFIQEIERCRAEA